MYGECLLKVNAVYLVVLFQEICKSSIPPFSRSVSDRGERVLRSFVGRKEGSLYSFNFSLINGTYITFN